MASCFDESWRIKFNMFLNLLLDFMVIKIGVLLVKLTVLFKLFI